MKIDEKTLNHKKNNQILIFIIKINILNLNIPQ